MAWARGALRLRLLLEAAALLLLVGTTRAGEPPTRREETGEGGLVWHLLGSPTRRPSPQRAASHRGWQLHMRPDARSRASAK